MTLRSLRGLVVDAVGGLLGGLAGGGFAVVVTELIKRILAVVSRQETWVLVVVPLVGLALSTLVLHQVGRGADPQTPVPGPRLPAALRRLLTRRDDPGPWRLFPAGVGRADLTAEVVRAAGQEERFPWRLAPVRAVAIVATVGLGAPMGTESPAAHLGVAGGAFLGDRGKRWRRLARPAGLGGGAAAVAALMGLPLVGLAYMLELGRRRSIPISAERLVAASAGALVGWGINVWFGLNLIRLIVPKVAPSDVGDALATAVIVGAVAGSLAALTGAAIHQAHGWKLAPERRLLLGALVVGVTAVAIAALAVPAAAIGPGGATIVWAENTKSASVTLLVVAVLRAVATSGAVVAGGCGGVFVPFLAIGDIAGRAFAPSLGVSGDLAGAAGAAGGIAGGYRLPATAVAMVVTLGGPVPARLTCLATVGVAAVAGVGAGRLLDRVTHLHPVATVTDH